MSEPVGISVVVVAYNQAARIRETLESIISDPYPGLEIIVFDNGSNDETAEIAVETLSASNRHHIVHRNETGISISRAINKAVAITTAPYLCFVPGDDLSIKGRFEKQMSFFERHPKTEILYANGGNFENGAIGDRVHRRDIAETLMYKTPKEVLDMLYKKRSLFFQTVMIRRSLFDAVGGFDEACIADDWILNIRIFRHLNDTAQYGYLDEDVFLYRRHPGGAHRQYRRQSELIFEVIRKYFPGDIKRTALAENFYRRAQLGFKDYGREHWRAALRYLALSLWHEFRWQRFKRGIFMAILAALGRKVPSQLDYKTFVSRIFNH